jgi:hypothetical protein
VPAAALEGSTVTKISLKLLFQDLLLNMAEDLVAPDPPEWAGLCAFAHHGCFKAHVSIVEM